MERKYILIDVMKNGQFICQLRYTGHAFPDFMGVERYDERDIRAFIERQRPLLKGTNYTFEKSNQQIYAY